MSIAEKLKTVAENEQKVFDAGKRAEYDRFWNTLQNNGEPANYYYKFSYNTNGFGWNDEIYNPKYPLLCAPTTTAGMALFYNNKVITDTKVPIIVQGSTVQSIFANCDNLVTVRCLSVHEGVAFSTSFVNCSKLQNITFEGVIGNSIDFSYSPLLSVASMKSVISCLKDFSSSGGTHTVTFKKNLETMLTAEEKKVATDKGWTLVWS